MQKNGPDAELVKERDRADRAVIDAKNQHGRSTENLRQAQRAVPAKEDRPQPPLPTIFGGIGGFTLLFMLTLIELPILAQIEEMKPRLLFAGSGAFVLAILVVFSTFNVKVASESTSISVKTTDTVTWQTLATFTLILAMGGMRFALAEGAEQQFLSFFIMLAEGGLSMYMKAAGARHTRSEDEYDRRHDGEAQKIRDKQTAEQEAAVDEQALTEAKAYAEEMRKKWETRALLDFDLQAAIDEGIAEVAAAYSEAVSELHGRGVGQAYRRAA
jgi:hypothetical protein